VIDHYRATNAGRFEQVALPLYQQVRTRLELDLRRWALASIEKRQWLHSQSERALLE